MLSAEYCLNEQYSIASTKRDASDNYIFRPRVCEYRWYSEDVFSIARYPISRFPRVILESNFNQRKVEFYNAVETFVKDGIGNTRGVCDKMRSSCFRSREVFRLIFSEYKTSTAESYVRKMRDEERRDTSPSSGIFLRDCCHLPKNRLLL